MKLRALVPVLLIGCVVQAQQRAPNIESITKEELRADLTFLASDAMQGRLTDTVTNAVAAEFVASRFQRLGLTPAGPKGSYFQPYNLMTASLGAANALAISGGPTARSGQDFYAARFSATGSAKGGVVFAGFGITWPEHGYDDYRGDVKGKIVLVVDHEPGERDPASPFDGLVTSEASGPLRKALAAQDKGAAGILFVSDVHNHPEDANFEASARTYWPAPPPRIERFTLATWMERVKIPAAQISPAFAAQILAPSGRNLEDLSKASETAKGAVPIPLPGVEVELTTAVERHVIPDRNVLALVEGSDPKLRDETVIVCAHYDHDGADGPRIFNGADDNGSGTIGLLEIAQAYALSAKAGQRPKRSVLLAAWNSEERGLLGAWAYTEDPMRPLDKTVGVLNMDMIGRNEEVPEGQGNTGRFRGLDVQTAESNANATNVIGTTRSPSLLAVIERANASIGLTLRLRYDNNISQLMRRSDHWPFLNRGIPGVWFHSGLHPDYHTVNDDADRINYEKMEKISRLVYQASWDLAQQTARPTLTDGSR
jgi:Peptidase family M28/PA domain